MLAATTEAQAQPNARLVVLIHPPSQDVLRSDAFNRLLAELHIHGFLTQSVERETGDDPSATLIDLVHDHAALAALSLLRNEAGLALVLVSVDQKTGQRAIHRLDFESPSGDAASLIAVRAVDLLRASLQDVPELEAHVQRSPEPSPPAKTVELRPPAPPPMATDSVPPPVVAEPEPAPELPAPRWTLAIEGALLWAGPHFGVGYAPALGLFHRPIPWLECGLWLSGPVFGTRLEVDTGKARVWHEIGLAEVRASVLHARGFSLAAVGGAGAYFLQATGEVAAPLLRQHDAVASAVLALGLRIEQRVGRGVAFGLNVRALAIVPALGVAVASTRQKVQLPSISATLGLAVGLE